VDLVGYPNGEPSGAPAEIFYCLSNEMHGYTLLANINNISIIDIFLKNQLAGCQKGESIKAGRL